MNKSLLVFLLVVLAAPFTASAVPYSTTSFHQDNWYYTYDVAYFDSGSIEETSNAKFIEFFVDEISVGGAGSGTPFGLGYSGGHSADHLLLDLSWWFLSVGTHTTYAMIRSEMGASDGYRVDSGDYIVTQPIGPRPDQPWGGHHDVPDAGATVALLSIVFAGLVTVRRFVE